jgi:hypothetical protein
LNAETGLELAGEVGTGPSVCSVQQQQETQCGALCQCQSEQRGFEKPTS